jgi:hypothetical protein
MDLQPLDINELKVMAYDYLAELERIQNNLRILNEEIAKRIKQKETTKEEVLESK